MIAQNRRVNRAHDLYRAFIRSADHNAVRAHEVFDSGALFKKLRIRYDGEIDRLGPSGEFRLNGRLHFAGSANRHRRLIDHEPVVLHVLSDRPCG